MLKRFFRHNHVLPLIGIGFIFFVIAGAFAWLYWEELSPDIFDIGNRFWSNLRDTPAAVFFGLMAILPLLPIPLSPFYLITGTIYGVWFSFAASAAVIFVNLSLAYYLATGFLRPFVDKIVSKYSYKVPKVYPSEYVKISIVLRITPGIPYFLKNYLNSLAGVPFKLYILIAWPLEMVWAIAFIVLGESAFKGSLGLAVSGICLVIALILITKIIRERYAKSNRRESITQG